MNLKELEEARRNPHINKKSSAIEEIIKYKSRYNQSYISFTAVDKLGVNPSSLHGTPVGIYCYPLDYAISIITAEGSTKNLPFAGSEKFANMFTLSGNVLNINSVSEIEFVSYCEKLPSLIDSELLEAIPDIIEQSGTYLHFGEKLYFVIRKYAELLAYEQQRQMAVVSTELFRKLKIDAIIDNGLGIIHRNEPHQGIIFNIKAIKNLYRVYNK